ncbi:transcriptional regulator with XRE-family HTH domain [Bradyrhizobium sp. USDA 3262]
MPTGRRAASEKFLSGTEIRAWRLSRNLTHAKLGAWLGLTPQAISKYELRGATKAIALALAALDRGLKPWRATKEDLKAIETNVRMKALKKGASANGEKAN